MIAPSDVLRQIVRRLPHETNRFCTEILHSNLRIEAGKLKFSGSVTSDYIVASGLKMLNSCTAVKSGPITLLTTANKHKITIGQDKEIETDAGAFRLHRSVDENKLEVLGDASAATLIKESLINSAGLMKVLENSAGGVEVKIAGESAYTCSCEGFIGDSRLNITIAKTTKRMVDHYASQPKGSQNLWMYIVFGDRRTLSKSGADAGQIATAQGAYLETLKVATEIDLYVWWPTNTKNENARAQLDEAYNAIYSALNRCLFGQISDTTGIGSYHCVPRMSGTAEAETLANYVHQYGFLVMESVSYADDGQRQRVDYFEEPLSNVRFDLLIKSGDEAPQPMGLQVDNFRSEDAI